MTDSVSVKIYMSKPSESTPAKVTIKPAPHKQKYIKNHQHHHHGKEGLVERRRRLFKLLENPQESRTAVNKSDTNELCRVDEKLPYPEEHILVNSSKRDIDLTDSESNSNSSCCCKSCGDSDCYEILLSRKRNKLKKCCDRSSKSEKIRDGFSDRNSRDHHCGSKLTREKSNGIVDFETIGGGVNATRVYEEVYNEQPERDSLNGPSSVPDRDGVSDTPIDNGKTPLGLGGGAIGGVGGIGRGHHKLRTSGGRRTFLGLLSGRASDMLEHTEAFCYLWVQLSSLYGKLIVILMVCFTLLEVMDNSVKLLSLQGIYLMYLYVGSIAVIICIYVWVLVDSCASFHNESDPAITTTVITDAELGSLSLTRFGSLKRAHISRDKTSATSFYLRVGALAFGLGTLVFNGLEMAMHSMMEGSCLNDVVFVHPVLHGLFTFLQMHFLFVNSQVLVEKFGLVARFGFMHLAATNLALWARLVIWESGMEWTYFVHLAQSSSVSSRSSSPFDTGIPTPLQLKGFPRSVTFSRIERDTTKFSGGVSQNASLWSREVYRPISDDHISQVVALHQCLNTNSLGQLWTSSMPFLYPFIVQFSLIAAGVTYIMGKNVGRDRIRKLKPQISKKMMCINNNNNISSNNNNSKLCGGSTNCILESRYGNGHHIDCSGSSKGLFLGLLCLVAGIVVIIIFLVVKEDEGFPTATLFWMTTGTLSIILSMSCIMTVIGLIQIRKLSHSNRSPTMLDGILSTVTLAGVQLYSVFSLMVGAATLVVATPHSSEQRQHIMLVVVSVLQLVQSGAQSTLIGEALRRGSVTRHQLLTKPGRQVITFLLCSNATLWAFDSFVTQSWLSQELQLRFLGVLAWGILSRISLPLVVFYRFHSGVLLLEVWQRAYRSIRLDSSN